MGSFSVWHWLVVLVVVLLLFGRGKISELMGDMAKGIKAFKKGMTEDEVADASKVEPVKTEPRTINHQSVSPGQPVSATTTDGRKVG